MGRGLAASKGQRGRPRAGAGGGVGGMSAAHELAEQGFSVTVIEDQTCQVERPARFCSRLWSGRAPGPTC